MKKSTPLFLFLFLLRTFLYAQEETIQTSKLDWIPTYKQALKKAKKEKKPVLIYFKGSDWCGPCKTIEKELLATQKFEEFANENLILLEVDIPRDLTILPTDKLRDNLIVKQKYRVNSFPTFLFVNHRGRKIDVKSGYILTEYYFPFFEKVVRKYKKS